MTDSHRPDSGNAGGFSAGPLPPTRLGGVCLHITSLPGPCGIGDIGHTGVFDTSKIRRFVPGFAPKLTFHRAARRMVQWRSEHPDTTGADLATLWVIEGAASYGALLAGAVGAAGYPVAEAARMDFALA